MHLIYSSFILTDLLTGFGLVKVNEIIGKKIIFVSSSQNLIKNYVRMHFRVLVVTLGKKNVVSNLLTSR